MSRNWESVDVVVVGAGMAGLVAAVRIAESGIRPLVVEKAPRAGGSMRLSGGHIWTVETLAKARETAPHGNRHLQRVVVESFTSCLDWLATKGVSLREYDSPRGVGKKCEPEGVVEVLSDRLRTNGGALQCVTPMRDLVTDDAGHISGVVVEPDDGTSPEVIETNRVVLATGGFQGNNTLLEQYITDQTDNLWLRANRWSTGDGFQSARQIGAKSSDGMTAFYGHNMVAPPAEFGPADFINATQYYGPLGLALNQAGERFTDESATGREDHVAQQTLRKADGRACYLLDSAMYESSFVRPVRCIVDSAAAFGGPVVESKTLRDLRETLRTWDFNGKRAVETLEAYNAAIRAGNPENLDPPRHQYHDPLDSPPYFAVMVQPGITFTVGGLAVTERMEVLRVPGVSGGTDKPRPIEGLYAAGADIGNVHHGGYIGGLATALVTGYIAGSEIVRSLSG